MTIIESCIDFWTSFVPEFPQRIRGAATEQITELESLMERPLSAIYREFLERMGEDRGPLNLGLYSTSPEYLIEQRLYVLENLPEGIELFASPTGDDEEDIFLVHGGQPDPEVVRHDDVPLADDGSFDRSKTESVAGSLAELLCLPALNQYHSLRQPFRATWSEKELREDTLERCRRLAAIFGFEPYWFSSPQTFAARRGDLVIVAKQAPGFLFSVGIAGADEFDTGVVSRTLLRELDLKEYR
jgi:hypothetical protein